jgi:hypothetical protein
MTVMTNPIIVLHLRRSLARAPLLRHSHQRFWVQCSSQPQCQSQKWLSISRMLDLGGAPSSSTERNVARTVNASKNCKLQAVVFDLATLTRSIDDAPPSTAEAEAAATPATAAESHPAIAPAAAPLPDTSKIESIANLLNVKLGGSSSSDERRVGSSASRDDLTLLTGERAPPAATPTAASTGTGSGGDVYAKYASKLSSKGVGSVASVQLARQQADDSLKRGDAAGHWAARKMAAAPTTAAGGSSSAAATKWMARTGTGRLLQYLTQRSIRIALIPSKPDVKSTSEGTDMTALQRQLHDVVFDALVPPDPEARSTADDILSHAFRLLGRDGGSAQPQNPSMALLVSSREDYLREAKERGWMTCRVRPKNAPRGNVSTNYMVESVPDVRQVVDEINGISYSAVLNAR